VKMRGAVRVRLRSPVAKLEPARSAEGSLAVSENAALPGAERFRGLSRDSIAAVISKAVDANRIDLYLQPTVTLPQRKVRYYEAVSRLRTEDGETIPAGDFIDIAESI